MADQIMTSVSQENGVSASGNVDGDVAMDVVGVESVGITSNGSRPGASADMSEEEREMASKAVKQGHLSLYTFLIACLIFLHSGILLC
jgi:hypothetical protein